MWPTFVAGRRLLSLLDNHQTNDCRQGYCNNARQTACSCSLTLADLRAGGLRAEANQGVREANRLQVRHLWRIQPRQPAASNRQLQGTLLRCSYN